MFWNQYPYINLNDLNLDFLLKAIGEMQNEVKNFVTLNAVKYADPIQWDITRQYEKNTIVIDPLTGTAYISVQSVPSGVALNRAEYWTVVFDLSTFITQGNKNLTENVEDAGIIYSTFALNAGDWVIWNSELYKALVNMPIGTAYSVNSNIERVTVEEYIKDILTAIANEVQARIDADTTLQTNIDNEAIARANADLVLSNNIGDLTTLLTTNKTSTVDAINEVFGMASNAGIYNNTTPDSGLTTNIGLEEGVYNITSDLTINAQLVVPKGAIINVASGVTLTINGQILAGRYKIFDGAGSIVVDPAFQPVGFPEWFGAIVNDNSIDNSIYINKCLSIFHTTSLSDGIYYVQNTVVINRNSTNLVGVGQYWGNGGTMIKPSANNISPTVLLGFTSAPTTINDFCNGNKIEHLTISGFGSDFIDNSIALQLSYALRGYVYDVQCRDSSICCLNKCTVAIKIFKCDFFSTLLSTGDNTRTCDLLRIYNSTDELSVGASASLQIINCHFSIGGVAYAQSYGIRAFGARFSDLMITGCEINSVYNGLVLVGNNDRTGTLDILISNNIIDSVVIPVNFANMAFGMINFVNNYMAGTVATTTLLTMQTCVNIKIADCHFVGYSSNNCYGITISSCTSLQLLDNSFYEVSNCILLSGACLYSKFSGNAYINQNTGSSIISGAQLTNSEIDFRTEGSFNIGISITSMTKCSVNFTGFDATAPLTIGGVAVTPTNGYNVATDNYYSGVMSA